MALIPEKDWIKKIVKLEKESKKSTKKKVEKALVNAIQKRIPKEKFGILLSGGVDSCFIAFICKKAKADFICYTVGLDNSPDIPWAMSFAKRFRIPIKVKTFSLDEVHELFKEAKKALEHVDILAIGVGSVILAAMKMAKKDGIKTVFSGLGSEEIFAGYHHHAKAKDVHAECWSRLKTMWKRDMRRDNSIASSLGMEIVAPFLDDDLIREGMGIPPKRKISEEEKKIILREIAEGLGLPKKYAWRSKKAAQYGSWFDKAMFKLTKRKGFKKKDDYLRSL